jgi:hypothetical protein
MTKREALRQTTQANALITLGFTPSEAATLRRISLTLSRWAEHECNGLIERDETRGNRPFWSSPGSGRHYVAPVADRERGALRRLDATVTARNVRSGFVQNAGYYGVMPKNARLDYYVQGDPRGASLYILRPGDVPAGADVDSYYSRGVAIY